MHPAYRNPVSLIRQKIASFQCPLCFGEYDDSARFPMILCPEQHSACKDCVETDLFKKGPGKEERCPMCRKAIFKDNVRKFRYLNQIREVSKQLVEQGDPIKQAIELKDKERIKDKEQIQWLIKQNEQKDNALKLKDQELQMKDEEISRRQQEQSRYIKSLEEIINQIIQ